MQGSQKIGKLEVELAKISSSKIEGAVTSTNSGEILVSSANIASNVFERKLNINSYIFGLLNNKVACIINVCL